MKRDNSITTLCTVFALLFFAGGTPVSAHAADPPEIKAIRARFNAINAGSKRYKTRRRTVLWEEQSATCTGYYHNQVLIKILISTDTDDGRATEEYFFDNGQLIFVYEVSTARTKTGRKNIYEERFYFVGERLVRWISDGKTLKPLDTDVARGSGQRRLRDSREYAARLDMPR